MAQSNFLFMLSSGTAGKNYIEEVTRSMKLWINNTSLTKISLKAVHVMLALLPQKPSKSSKQKIIMLLLEEG